MRHLLLLALLGLAGCAGAGTLPMPAGSSISDGQGRTATIGSGLDAYAAPTRIRAPVDSAWEALVAAYGASGLPVDRFSRGSWTVGATRLTGRGRLLDVPPSTFLTCGGTAGIAEVADAHLVQMSVVATLTPLREGTRLQVRVGGTARDPFTSTAPRPCVTTGALEARVDSLTRAHLRGEALPGRVMGAAPRALPEVALPPAALPGAAPAGPALRAEPPARPAPLLWLAAGGIAGGALGTWAGSGLGADCETRCMNARGMLGPLVGNAVLVPLGVHLSNRGRGRLVQSFLVSSGWAALGAVVSGLSDESWAVIAVAPGQLFTSLLIERATTSPE